MKMAKPFMYVMYLSIVVFINLEIFFYLAETIPSLARFLPFISRHYFDFADIIQYNKECSRFDNSLGYTLKPGICQFKNPEFSTEIRVNSLGVRDDEQSLVLPKIVVVGDSDSMGWGVDTDEDFSSVIEERTGLTVLNAAISSYGTVREMRMLDRVDTRDTQFLIIQYHANDYLENLEFFEKRSDFRTMSLHEYREHVDEMRCRYVFGRALYLQLRTARNNLRKTSSSVEDHWGKFIYALEHAGKTDLARFHVIVLGYGHLQIDSDASIAGARLPLADPPQSFSVVDLAGIGAERYLLDPHYKASTHRKIGHALANIIEGYLRNPPTDTSIRIINASAFD